PPGERPRHSFGASPPHLQRRVRCFNGDTPTATPIAPHSAHVARLRSYYQSVNRPAPLALDVVDGPPSRGPGNTRPGGHRTIILSPAHKGAWEQPWRKRVGTSRLRCPPPRCPDWQMKALLSTLVVASSVLLEAAPAAP